MKHRLLFFALSLAAVMQGPAIGAPPRAELIATVRIPGDALDLSGIAGSDAKGTPNALLGSFGSGIDYDRAAGEVVAACDRGPRDGDNTCACRVQRFRLGIDAAARTATLTLTSTRLLTSSGGGQFVGTVGAVSPVFRAVVGTERTRIPARLDPEAVRLADDGGAMWIAEEYGPGLDVFTAQGRHVRRVAPPQRYVCRFPAKTSDAELPPVNTSGRQPNRGFEGLALSPDGKTAYLMTQSPLIQDGGLDADNKRVGINMRLLRATLSDNAVEYHEFLYLLDRPTHGVNELLADGDTHLLVLERDGKKGSDAAFRGVYRVEIGSATDISGVERLPALGMPPGVTPVRKELFLDLLDPAFGLAGEGMPEKIEGLCWGPSLTDGRRTLLVSSDNDLVEEAATVVWVFAVGEPENAVTREPGVKKSRAR